MSSFQNLPPMMPFIEPTDPIELPINFQPSNQQDSKQNQQNKSFKSQHSNQSSTSYSSSSFSSSSYSSQLNNFGNNMISSMTNDGGRQKGSEEEMMIEKTRMELERKIEELNQIKNQLAKTERRQQELASKIST